MSKYEFVVKTYSYDQTGYYIGQSDELTITLIAENTEEARKKALDLRKTDRMNSCHDTWAAKVISAKGVEEVGRHRLKIAILDTIERDWGPRCTTKDVEDSSELHDDLVTVGDNAGRCPVCLVYEKFDVFWQKLTE